MQRPRTSLKEIVEKNVSAARGRGGKPCEVTFWEVDGTPLDKVSKVLRVDVPRFVRTRLKAGKKVTVLDDGCGYYADAMVKLAEKYPQAVKEGKLELHGLHISNYPEAKERVVSGVRIHNATPLDFRRLGIRPDLIIDHCGAIYHASESPSLRRTYGAALTDSLAKGGLMALLLAGVNPEQRKLFASVNPKMWNMRGVNVKLKHVYPAPPGYSLFDSSVFHIIKRF